MSSWPPQLVTVMGHRVQLQEVILNLIHNAIDAMVPIKVDRRVLKVRTKTDGAKAIILEVEDSGGGIEAERLSSIFEAFVTTKSNGRGLGSATPHETPTVAGRSLDTASPLARPVFCSGYSGEGCPPSCYSLPNL
jgi:C4-dicarboxylate-specific signal transduction histidine kinase